LNRLERNYDRLTGDERFRLAIAALSRDDVEEVRSLVDPCPRFDYRMKDWEYFERANASVHIVMLLALELAPQLYTIRFVDTFANDAWGIDATEVIEAHSDMFEDLSPYLKEIGEVPVGPSEEQYCSLQAPLAIARASRAGGR
jgi:hypothetical protein